MEAKYQKQRRIRNSDEVPSSLKDFPHSFLTIPILFFGRKSLSFNIEIWAVPRRLSDTDAYHSERASAVTVLPLLLTVEISM